MKLSSLCLFHPFSDNFKAIIFIKNNYLDEKLRPVACCMAFRVAIIAWYSGLSSIAFAASACCCNCSATDNRGLERGHRASKIVGILPSAPTVCWNEKLFRIGNLLLFFRLLLLLLLTFFAFLGLLFLFRTLPLFTITSLFFFV